MGVVLKDVDFDIQDIIYLIRFYFKDRCFLTNKLNKKNVYMTRWDPKKKASITNMILVSK